MTTTFFYVWPLWCACSFSDCEWACCHGTLLCEFSIPKCGGVLGGNDQNRAEKQNVVPTWFRPVTWSSGHLGRRTKATLNSIKLDFPQFPGGIKLHPAEVRPLHQALPHSCPRSSSNSQMVSISTELLTRAKMRHG